MNRRSLREKKQSSKIQDDRSLAPVPVLESDAIKELFWTDRHQKKHGEFIPPPKALQRDVKTIKNFLKSGNQQKNQEIAKYKQFDEQLIKESNDDWDVSDITAACKTMDTEPTSCKGITFQDIGESTKLTQERRKDEIKIGMWNVSIDPSEL
eukprot:scaffold129720_cov53-Cyclotella_meneghiniana.AAC.1